MGKFRLCEERVDETYAPCISSSPVCVSARAYGRRFIYARLLARVARNETETYIRASERRKKRVSQTGFGSDALWASVVCGSAGACARARG